MDTNDQIEKFGEFLDSHYKKELNELTQLGKQVLNISFAELAKFDYELAEELLSSPEDTIRSCELAVEQVDKIKEKPIVRVRFYDLPETQRVRISDVRSSHLGKFLVIEGIVKQASDVRPQVTNAKFECAGCGNTISILQIDTKFKEPSRCTCGWRGKFRLLSKDLIDVQHLNVEEVPIQLKTGAQSTRYDLILEANNVEAAQEDFSEITLDKEDEDQIRALGTDPKIFEKLTEAIAPSIYGHEKIKDALVLQLMGGVRKQKPDGIVTRGDVHVLLVGDPGSGKSQILQFMSKA